MCPQKILFPKIIGILIHFYYLLLTIIWTINISQVNCVYKYENLLQQNDINIT